MKINLIQTLVISLATYTSFALHLQTQTQPRIYDPQAYAQTLQNTQDRLKAQLLNIQSTFKALDESIKNAANDPNMQLRLYQQGIADQRDALYDIQQYLTLPFNQRACACFNFTEDMRIKFNTQLESVQQSLNNVQYQAQQCKDCGMAKQIQNEIKINQGYLSTMKDTINARCCKIYKYIYIDNLTASNWINGGWTPQEYQAWMGSQIKSVIANNSNNNTLVRSCSMLAPYANSDLSQCGQCPDQNMLFNIKTRLCQQCPSGKIFNYQRHSCDYNVICPPGSAFNQKTVMCQKIYPAFNASWCPPQSPIWNPQLLGCFKCSSSTPYYDINAGICTTCVQGTVYNPSTNQCVHENCTINQIYNPNTKQCQTRVINTTNVQPSNSQCPANRPYWDKLSLSCSRCPSNLPYYNTTINTCQVCPNNSTYDIYRDKCTIQCPSNQQLNLITMRCENITVVQPSDNNLASLCPPDKPIWNSLTKSCSQCNNDKPYWNSNINQCQICPVDKQYNSSTNKCDNIIQQVICQTGTVYNPTTRQCQRRNGSIAYCPPQKPYYNIQIMACTQCPLSLPYYNQLTNLCQASNNINITCPNGYTYNTTIKQCVLIVTNINTTLTQCPPSTPIWDSNKNTCVACPIGYTYNIYNKTCIKCIDPTNCGVSPSIPIVINKTCQYNYQWSNITQSCIKCKIYQKYNNITKICDNFCKPGQVYDSNYNICSGTISNCPIGLVYDTNRMLCICQEGVNFKYYPDLDRCQVYCTTNQQFNYLTQVCQPL